MGNISGRFPEGGVYCTGNIVVDFTVKPVEAMPPWGTSLRVDSISQHLGGNGAATSYTLGKLGAPVRLASAVGDDSFGRYALDRLRSAGVDVSEVRIALGFQTATTVGIVNARGERLFLHAPGASAAIAPDQLRFDPCGASSHACEPASLPASAGFRYFHLASIFHLPKMRAAAPEVLARARRSGLITSVDTVWDTTARWMQDFAAVCPETDILFLNQDEARMLAGSDDPREVGRFFQSRGVQIVALKLGAAGCAICAPGEHCVLPAFEVPVADSTGAGDCFCGAFLAALRKGFSLQDAARFANAVAAHTIQHIGNTEGIPSFEETEQWIAARADG